MTKLFDDAANFATDALDGFVLANPSFVERVDGGVVRATRAPEPHVGVVIGGGSGHYPAFAGLVGKGFATGAVCGNVFTSPSAAQAYRVAERAHEGRGILFSFGNYAGDVLHFGLAQDRLRAEGIDVRTVLVTDDVASAPAHERHKRRGIAGDFTVFKIAGAAAERGFDLNEVERLAIATNDRTFTMGVAFDGCTFPGADAPLFTVPAGTMSLGLGIHGEPGISEHEMSSAAELANLLLDPLLAERAEDAGDRVAVIVNGLGTVKYEELFVLYRHVAARLDVEGLTIVEPECGELVTSLDMGGVSVTLFWLTPELEALWCDPAYAPGYRKGMIAGDDRARTSTAATVSAATTSEPVTPLSESEVRAAELATSLLRAAQQTLHENADELGRIDAIAGDGDHGVGMARGIDAAVRAAESAAPARASELLRRAGEAWADEAGGTSGALWGAALGAMGLALQTEEPDASALTLSLAESALNAITRLGGASPGDKTMVDALVPYVESLSAALTGGSPVPQALSSAAQDAGRAAEETAALRPALGRARPLAERSLGHPDAGATSLALIVRTIADTITKE
jgi:dihydroxyacetone kinase